MKKFDLYFIAKIYWFFHPGLVYIQVKLKYPNQLIYQRS